MLRFLKVLARNLSLGPSTDAFPFKEAHTPERYRGRVVIDPDRCMGCHVCQHVCAGKAIRIEDNEEKTGYRFTIWHNTCALCGMCQHFCPVQAIKQTTDWHNAHTQDEKYAWADNFEIPYLSCLGCGTHIRVLPPDLAARVYAHSPENMQKIMQLCPTCRQLAAARRQEVSMQMRAELAAKTAAPEAAAPSEAPKAGQAAEEALGKPPVAEAAAAEVSVTAEAEAPVAAAPAPEQKEAAAEPPVVEKDTETEQDAVAEKNAALLKQAVTKPAPEKTPQSNAKKAAITKGKAQAKKE